MLKRIVLSVLVGVLTALVVWVIGAILAALPVVAGVGIVLQGLAWIFGIIAGIWFFISGRTFWE